MGPGSAPAVLVVGVVVDADLLATLREILQQGGRRVYVHLDPGGERSSPPAGIPPEVADLTASQAEPVDLRWRTTRAHFGERWAHLAALDWAFTTESELIVVAAGATPAPDDLRSLTEGLRRYASDRSVGQLATIAPGTVHRPSSPGFRVPLGPLDVWATWRDRWLRHEGNAFLHRGSAARVLRDRGLPIRSRLILARKVVQVSHGLDEFRWGWWATLRTMGSSTVLVGALPDAAGGAHRAPTPVGRRAARSILMRLELLAFLEAAKSVLILLRRHRDVSRTLAAARRMLSRTVRRVCLRSGPTLVVASSGRAASSTLFDAVRHRIVMERLRGPFRPVLRSSGAVAWLERRLGVFMMHPSDADLSAFAVIKTHAIPTEIGGSVAYRAVFTHAEAAHTAESLHRRLDAVGSAWVDMAAAHFGAEGRPYDFIEDPAGMIGRQHRAWSSGSRARVITLRDLWSDHEGVAEWLGLQDLGLPPHRAAITERPASAPAS